MKKLLIHTCCAPCLIAPYLKIKDDYDITALWANGNIHPYTEYKNRLDTVREYTITENINYIENDEYGLTDFVQKSAYREEKRCYHCYFDRLDYTAKKAKEKQYDFFSTSLLYSKFQNHDLIKEIGLAVAKRHQIEFYYEDFRELWKKGIELSKQKKMYRQQYCGCVYSEYLRYNVGK